MSYYEGLSCPVCNEPFTDEADVVVCPQCGLPHHRSCWATENHCHEADKHGTPEQWSREKATTTEAPKTADPSGGKICPKCSTENAEFAEFCTRCGAELEVTDWHSAPATPPPPPPPTYAYTPRYTPFTPQNHYEDNEIISNTPAKELAAVVGNNTPYYMAKFRNANQKKLCGWNWAACLLGPLWMLYRKQYALGGIAFVIDTACVIIYNVITSSLSMDPNTYYNANAVSQALMQSPWFPLAMVTATLLITLRVLLGVFGNNLYLNTCKRRIRKAKTATPDISSFELSTRGGVSFGLAIVFYFISNLLSVIVTTFFQ